MNCASAGNTFTRVVPFDDERIAMMRCSSNDDKMVCQLMTTPCRHWAPGGRCEIPEGYIEQNLSQKF